MNDMDGQNAVESTTSRSAVLPDRRPQDIKKATLDLPSSPPLKLSLPPSGPPEDNANNSDAETVLLPGIDGYSPSKTRKVVNRNDRKPDDAPIPFSKTISNGNHRPHPKDADRDRDRDRERGRDADKPQNLRRGMGGLSAEAASSLVAKKKPLQDRQRSVLKDANSSGLSSAPGSPPPTSHRRASPPHLNPPRRPQTKHRVQPESDSESPRAKSPKPRKERDPSRLGERDRLVPPNKRKGPPKADSDDEGEYSKKIRRHQPPDRRPPPRDPKTSSRQHPPESHLAVGPRTRSLSPHQKPHRRSLSSTQVSSTNGLGHKKKRVPPPLTTDCHSDDSSASGSTHPRSHRMRSLAAPATADINLSPAKMAPPKKHLDAHGQTLLARACARGEYEVAKARLLERPGDLNVADYAGNTPLQISSLHGHEEIVRLLINSSCALDCVNNDRDTPLLDAVDNGHLAVIRLLLDAGVNPRKTNLNGEEPLDRVSDDQDNAAEIRAAIRNARNKPSAAWRKASEEHHGHDQSPQEPNPPDMHSRDARSHGPESPSSPAAPSSAILGRRAATSRSNKTSNSQLYKPLDDKTLREAACRGDEETVLRILQVKDGFDDPESMVGAARGGHETVMQYLLALGNADPDPDQIPHLAADASTPMLAAIGQGTLGIVRLLLAQPNFDPTRKFKGETYYDISSRRQGPEWEDEEHMLKEAYEKKKGIRSLKKDKSPLRRTTVKARAARSEVKDEPSRPLLKRKHLSPVRDQARLRAVAGKSASPKEAKCASSFSANDDPSGSKPGPGRPRKEFPSVSVSSRDDSPQPVPKTQSSKAKRQEVDHGANSSEGEAATVKPRRKLVSGQQLKHEREREKQRRSSLVSNNSTKDSSSPKDRDEGSDKSKAEPPSEKYHDRAKAIRRDDSTDRLSGPGKRYRPSVTPPRPGSCDKEDGDVTVKRRRLEVEAKEKRPALSTNSPTEERPRKPSTLRDGTPGSAKSLASKDPEKEAARREAIKAKKLARAAQSADKLVKVKTEDTEMPTSHPVKTEEEASLKARRDEEKERRAKIKASEARKREEHRRLEEARRQKEEERNQREAEEARKKAEAQKLEEEKRQREEQDRKRLEQERLRREEEELKRKEEEERKRKEEERKHREEERRRKEEERKRKEEERKRRQEEELKRKEEERMRLEEEMERKRLEEEEEERKRRAAEDKRRLEEEARVHKEQLEREAAEAARIKEAEERERLRREEEEQHRLAAEAEMRRIREEQEKIRLAKLPPLLRWFDGCDGPKTRKVAERFTNMHGVRYDTMVPNATGSAETLRELWVLNTHVAILLGDKDLGLSNYPSWPRLRASHIAKTELYGVEGGTYALISRPFWDLAKELPGYFGNLNGSRGLKMAKDRGDAFQLFEAMDLFFVRVADFMSIAAETEHLRDLEISVQYKELPLNDEMHKQMQLPRRWKDDAFWANRNHGAAPGALVYVNGRVVDETKTGHLYRTSRTPFADGPVPRRGFTAVSRHDPDYERLCREQGLEYLVQNGHGANGTQAQAQVQVQAQAPSPISPRQFHIMTPVTPGPTEPGGGGDGPGVVNGINGNHE